jgi:hypothetical protein
VHCCCLDHPGESTCSAYVPLISLSLFDTVGGKDGHTRKRGIFCDMYIKNGRSPLYIIKD